MSTGRNRRKRKLHREMKDGIGRFMKMHGIGEVDRNISLTKLAEKLESHLIIPRDGKLPFLSTRHRTMAALVDLHNQFNPEKPLPNRVTKRFDKPLHFSHRARLFYLSVAWLRLRYEILEKYGRVCMACGEIKGSMHVDHIKPLRKYWHLRLDPENLQVLCGPCNLGKGNRSETDFRPG